VTEAVVFRSPDEERAEIKGRVLARLLAHTQEDSTAPEAGGILMGRRILDSGDVVVDMVTEPFPTDQRGRFKFVRFPEGHQQALDQEWSESGGAVSYLGEWHTHPAPTSVPSAKDCRNWRQLEHSSLQRLIFLILGTDCALGCWSDGVQWGLEG